MPCYLSPSWASFFAFAFATAAAIAAFLLSTARAGESATAVVFSCAAAFFALARATAAAIAAFLASTAGAGVSVYDSVASH